MTFKSKPRRRTIRAFNREGPAAFIGDITTGTEVFGLCSGQFCIAELIEYCAHQIGPCRALISTWTAHSADLGRMEELLRGGAFTECRWLVDRSFQNRQPEFFSTLQQLFPDKVRIIATHAKFTLLRNERFDLVIQTSMNLNSARRLENFEVSEDRDLADAIETYVQQFFDQPATPAEIPLATARMQNDPPEGLDALSLL